jgi:ABC-type glycerol-3-phosphate transport system permease component
MASHVAEPNIKSRVADGQSARRTRRIRQTLNSTTIVLLLLGFGFLFALPLFWMISTSLKVDAQIFVYPPIWIPNPIQWSNYLRAVNAIPFGLYARNTLTISILSMIGQVISSSLVGYGFARIRWPGRDLVFILVLSTMMLPYQATMIPLYIVFRKLGWVGTFAPLIVPSFFGHAFNIFLFRQFFRTIPNELADAARMDGCNEFGIYRWIILPLSKPVIATVALFDFLYNWNDFQGPLIYLQDSERYTLSLGLQSFGGNFGRAMEPAMLMAAAAIVVLPAILVFFLAQRTFIQGISLTGIKG